MRGFSSAVKKKLPLFAVLMLLALAGVFLLRSPVLVVTDASFNRLYGSRRSAFALARNSLLLFRRVVPVPVSEQAGPDLIALVAEAFPSPHAVVFPQRYLEAARLYHARNEGVPVLVFWGRNPLPRAYLDGSGIVFVRTDTAVDLYRAGLSAAALAGEGGVFLFSDGSLQVQCREAFDRGLRGRDFAGGQVYMGVFTEHLLLEDAGSVVLAGPAAAFLEQNLGVPALLFSWIDPARTPRSVKIVFNDSPLALASAALRAPAPEGGEIFLPSRAALLSDRIEERELARELRGLIRGRPAESLDAQARNIVK